MPRTVSKIIKFKLKLLRFVPTSPCVDCCVVQQVRTTIRYVQRYVCTYNDIYASLHSTALDGHVNHGSIRSQMYVRYGVRPPAVRYVQSQTASEVQPPTAYGTRTTTGTKNNRQSFCKSVAINFSSFWATLLAWNTENTSRTVEKVVRGFGESFGSNELLITVFRGKIYFLHIER